MKDELIILKNLIEDITKPPTYEVEIDGLKMTLNLVTSQLVKYFVLLHRVKLFNRMRMLQVL